MNPDMSISPLGLKLIKSYEGFRPHVTQLVTGQRVIGYGHICDSDDMPLVSRTRAEELLRLDVESIEALVADSIYAPLTQGQFDALCSLAFNIGEEKFLDSHVRRALNNGRVLDAANAFDEWRKAEIGGQVYVIDALVRRRTSEKSLFLKHEAGGVRASRNAVDVQSDDSFVPVSDVADIFDPQTGIVDQVQYAARPVPARRREDGPLGILTLSEVAPEGGETSPRTVFDPQTDTADLIEDDDNDVGNLALVTTEYETSSEPAHAAPISDADIEDYILDIPRANEGQGHIGIAPSENQSPIAVAAAQVSERLDALIDSSRLQTPGSGEAELDDDILNDVDVSSNAPNVTDIKDLDAGIGDEAKSQPQKKTVKGPDAYIQKGLSQKKSGKAANESALGAYAVFMIIGGCLLTGGTVLGLGGPNALSPLMTLLVPVAVVCGLVMLCGAFYYMARETVRSRRALSKLNHN